MFYMQIIARREALLVFSPRCSQQCHTRHKLHELFLFPGLMQII